MERWDMAAKDFEHVIRIFPAHQDAKLQYALCFLQKGLVLLDVVTLWPWCC